MAAPTYTTKDRVIERLTTLYDATVLTDTVLDRIIGEASDDVGAALRTSYIQFNDIDDTPATPRVIERLCLANCLIGCWELLKPLVRGTKLEPQMEQLSDWRDEEIAAYLSGKKVVPNETVTSEVLTWGDGSQYGLLQNVARLGATGAATSGEVITIIEPSVRVVTPAALTGYRVGRGFDLYTYFDPTRRWWLLVDSGQRLQAQASTITYQWSYLRYAEPPVAGDQASGVFQFV